MKGKTYGVKNIYQLLKSRQFINLVPCEVNKNTHTLLEYGVPGTFLRQNIKRKWWRMMVEEQSNAFAVEKNDLHFDDYRFLLSDINNREKYDSGSGGKQLNEYRRMYMNVLKLTNGCLPFSVVSDSHRFNLEDEAQEKDSLPSGLTSNTLVSQCYTPPSGVNRVFDFWLQQRLSWWKKFSKNPSKFSVSSSTENKVENKDSVTSSATDNGHTMLIQYEFPWGPESVEVVHNHGDTIFRNVPESEEKTYGAKTTGGKKCIPFCIQCTMSLETAVKTFLIDAYHERTSVSQTGKSARLSPVLQLHPQLSPFQSALWVTSDDLATTNELLHVSTKLEQDLRKACVSVLNASQHGASQDAHFRRNDQLGIPYTLIVNERTLQDGTIIVRCRDTEIMKPLHVSRAVEELKRYVESSLE